MSSRRDSSWADQALRFSTRWKLVKWRAWPRPMIHSAEATVRRPGTRIAPITSTSTCSQVGAVKASRKGRRTITRLCGTLCPAVSAIHLSPNRWLGETRRAQVRGESRGLSRPLQVTQDSTRRNATSKGTDQWRHLAAERLSRRLSLDPKMAKVELRLHSRYGPLDCSTVQDGLCHEA